MTKQYFGIKCDFPAALCAASAKVVEFGHDGDMKELTAVLKECLARVLTSEASAYAGMGVAEIVSTLQDAIAKMEQGEPIDKAELKLLFAPTGALQEISIDNGWGDEFLALSARFDRAI